VRRKICFKHIIKTKILPPEIYVIWPQNLKTRLRARVHEPQGWELLVYCFLKTTVFLDETISRFERSSTRETGRFNRQTAFSGLRTYRLRQLRIVYQQLPDLLLEDARGEGVRLFQAEQRHLLREEILGLTLSEVLARLGSVWPANELAERVNEHVVQKKCTRSAWNG